MLRDIVLGLVSETPDVVIAGEVAAARAAAALSSTEANFVISCAERPELVERLLFERPTVEVLTVERDGGHAELHRLVPEHTPVDELWAQRLLEIVRAAAERLSEVSDR